AIATGEYHTCALTRDGDVKCWGNNQFGQLGDGTTEDSSVPVDVRGLSKGVYAIAMGHNYSCALTSAREVKCWGSNDYGQLGDGTTINRLMAVDVSGLSSGVEAISAGFIHTCALTSGGGVRCWGDGGAGNLGDGKKTDSPIPVEVAGL